MERILVSHCLLGQRCRYNGGHCRNQAVIDLEKNFCLVPICPEVMGGLGIPRTLTKIQPDGRTVDKNGVDKTANLHLGIQISLDIAGKNNCKVAVLHPECQLCAADGKVIDGIFTGKLSSSEYGKKADLLHQHGIQIYFPNETENVLKFFGCS